MRFRQLLPVIALGFAGCKGSDTPAPSHLNPAALAGTYTGVTLHKYRTNTGTNIYEDSTLKTDTMLIAAIGADSFQVMRPKWEIAQPAFLVVDSFSYSRQRGTPSFNDHMDELSVVFDTASHRVSVHRHHVAVSSWVMEDWDTFDGIRQ